MSRTGLILLLFAFVFCQTEVLSQTCDSGTALAADTVIVRSVPEGMRAGHIHLRAGLPASGDFEWGLILKDTEGRSRRIVISGNTDDLHDGDYPAAVFFTDSVAHVMKRRVSLATAVDEFSLRITGRYGEFGSKYSDYDFEIGEEDIINVSAFLSRGMRMCRFDVTSERIDRPEICRLFDSQESLNEYFADTKDSREGFWTYLDRNLDYKDCTLGGQYRLACVSDREGGYLLLYISGAERGARIWTPMMIKGRLRPTAFAGHYDLIWTDAFGHTESGAESNASFDMANSLLTLDFPLYGRSQLRFAKSK